MQTKISIFYIIFLFSHICPQAAAEDQKELINNFLRNDNELGEKDLQINLEGVYILEDFIISPPKLNRKEYRNLLSQLTAEEWLLRENASCKLETSGPASLPWIKSDLKGTKDPELKIRLIKAHKALEKWDDKIKRIEKVLTTVYKSKVNRLWKNRIDKKSETGKFNSHTKLFLSLIPLKVLKEKISQTDKQMQINIILNILFGHNMGPNLQLAEGHGGSGYSHWAKELQKFDADNLMKICAKLWTIELESPYKSGAYYWTYRAEKVKNGQAENVIRMSIDKQKNKSNIVHFEIYRETKFDKKKIGPFISWEGSRRGINSWMTPSPNAWKYLPTDD